VAVAAELLHASGLIRVHELLRIVGLSGPLAAGKTTVAGLLKGFGFSHISIRAVLEDILPQGQTPSRAELQELGMRVHDQEGQLWLYEAALARVRPEVSLVVIDSMRFGGDPAIFARMFGVRFLHLHICAPQEIRRLRYMSRGGSAQEFDLAEMHPVEGEVELLASAAQRTIVNEGTQLDLDAGLRVAIEPSG
jgi:hypothetical protein